METVLFPRAQRLARAYLLTQLAERGLSQHVGTKDPDGDMPDQWIRLRMQGGPKTLYEWRVMIDTYCYATDEVVAEGNANLVHSLMLDVPGVAIAVPDWPEPFPWVRLARHISGPTALDSEEDLPNLEVFRIVTTWHVLPIPQRS
ncbi:hypothetical protein SEA_JACOREN57_11 [Mycobacterium phage JacoRen57]|nr:hypothetical protein SEA_JACOREN57_11 [Mycobacterium phage JacoRen57]